MFGFDKIDLSFSFGTIYFVIGILILAAYTFYVYRYTLPPISNGEKIILSFLRLLALLLLLFIFFEPVLTLTKKNILAPVNLFFFDNSRSIQFEDKTNRATTLKSLVLQTLNNNKINNAEFYLFGSDIKNIPRDSLINYLNFSDASTNFSDIFNTIKTSDKNISAISIISDGNITTGSTPIYTAEKLGIPIFTVGIGDSSFKNDVEIKNVNYNEIIYSGSPTTILATIVNKGFTDKTTAVSLYEDNKLLEQKNILLNKSGINSLEFNYTPQSQGDKKLSLRIANLDGEENYFNNQKNFYINVLDNKINVLLIAGSPSADLTFIKSAIETDKNLRVNTLTKISSDKFLENSPQSKLDSADIIFLLNYPTANSSNDFFERVLQKLENKSTPFFTLVTIDVSLQKIARLNNLLPVTIQSLDKNYLQVQPDIQIQEIKNPIIQSNPISDWNNLPPIYQPFGVFIAKPESKIISKVKVNTTPRNVPLIVTRNFGSKRSIIVIGQDIWRWKLQMSTKAPDLFDNFILNSTKWLNSPEQNKRVKIVTSKKSYSAGEDVEFFAQVYDESLNPVNDAEVNIKIRNNNEASELTLNGVGNGLYEGKITLSKLGDYVFTGTASIDSKQLGEDKGIFNIGDIDIEMQNTRMNYEFLNLLSRVTKGKYYNPDKYEELLLELERINKYSSKEKIQKSEIRLWSYEWLLVIVVLLFSLEWFIRKRNGLL
jgi:hypothetical protein